MSGNYSRNKGSRGEYALRDHFRRLGFESNRVPSSGAAEGFKGDVTYKRDLIQGTVELKCRKDAFRNIYAMYDKEERGGKLCLITTDGVTDRLVLITKSFIIATSAVCHEDVFKAYGPEYKRVVKKVGNLYKLKQSCDLLVLKDDRKDFLFLRYI